MPVSNSWVTALSNPCHLIPIPTTDPLNLNAKSGVSPSSIIRLPRHFIQRVEVETFFPHFGLAVSQTFSFSEGNMIRGRKREDVCASVGERSDSRYICSGILSRRQLGVSSVSNATKPSRRRACEKQRRSCVSLWGRGRLGNGD